VVQNQEDNKYNNSLAKPPRKKIKKGERRI